MLPQPTGVAETHHSFCTFPSVLHLTEVLAQNQPGSEAAGAHWETPMSSSLPLSSTLPVWSNPVICNAKPCADPV